METFINKSSRSIIGNDDRMVADINNTGRWANVYIKSVFAKSKNKCSGSLISDNAVLTAAHCVSNNATEYAESITVYPGRSNGEMPTGFYEVSKTYTLHDWQSDIRGKYDYDMAVLIIEPDENGNYPTDKGAPVYSYGYWQVDFTGVPVRAYGYPGDHDDENRTYDVMYEMYNGRVSTMQSDYDKFNNSLNILSGNQKVTSENTLMHSLDTSPGSSGAGILWRYNGQERIIGVNSQQCSTDEDEKVACKDTDGNEILNTAARFTKSSYTQVSTVVSDNEVKK